MVCSSPRKGGKERAGATPSLKKEGQEKKKKSGSEYWRQCQSRKLKEEKDPRKKTFEQKK